jgi:hypothetical protein
MEIKGLKVACEHLVEVRNDTRDAKVITQSGFNNGSLINHYKDSKRKYKRIENREIEQR